jgi:hypothetical protein
VLLVFSAVVLVATLGAGIAMRRYARQASSQPDDRAR